VELLDVAFALVSAAAILRVPRMPRFTRWQRWALLVGIMLLLSLVRGAVAFGPQHAIAEARLFVPFVPGALYFATFPPSSRLNDRIGRMWRALSIPTMILVCLRSLDNFAGINLGLPPAQFGEDAAIKVWTRATIRLSRRRRSARARSTGASKDGPELLAGLSTDPVQWGIGEPLGSDFTREVQRSEVRAEPHNFYLAFLLRGGAVGLLALIALTGGLLRALCRIPPPGGQDGLLAPGVFPALLALQVVWLTAWTPGMEQGIITGLAVGLAAYSRGGVRILRARPPSLVSGGKV
jgi:hypothetical protein